MSLEGDELHWLRDDARQREDVLQHLAVENQKAAEVVQALKSLQQDFEFEVASRVPAVEKRACVRKGDYVYYESRQEGDQYWRILRKETTKDSNREPGDVCVLDPNSCAQRYWDLGSWDVSPCGQKLAYTCDVQGREKYQVVVRDMSTPAAAPIYESGPSYKSEVFWGPDSATLFCVQQADGSRAAQSLVKLRVQLEGQQPRGAAEAAVVYLNSDEHDSFEATRTRDGSHMLLHLKRQDGSDQVLACSLGALVAANQQQQQQQEQQQQQQHAGAGAEQQGWKTVASMAGEDADLLWVDHWEGCWLGVVDSDDSPNGCICHLGLSGIKVLLAPDDGFEVDQVQLSARHMVVLLRHRCQFQLAVYELQQTRSGQQAPVTAKKLWQRQLPACCGSVSLLPGGPFQEAVVQLQQSGLTMPVRQTAVDLVTQEETIVQEEEVAGGFAAEDYTTELLWVDQPVGVQVPVHFARHNKAYSQDGKSPVLLLTYGAYSNKLDPSFNPAELALLDRGYGIAIAHVRGGGELGWRWHADGRRLHKKNTFLDLIACVDFLVERNYCSKASIVGWGRSAGGLAMGAALNMRPDLFAAVVMDVPFLDPLNTMMDPSLPLTVREYGEWGDPAASEEAHRYIQSYAPYDNIRKAAYPHMLLTAGLHDHRVNYWEPAKYTARMRQRRTDDTKMLMLIINDQQSGHFASSAAGDRLQERALKYAFFSRALALSASPDSPH